MHVSELPATRLIDTVSDSRLRSAIAYAMDGNKDVVFTHYTIVQGLPYSGRLLLTHPAFDAVEISPPKSRGQMCEELWRWLQYQARFDPHPPPVMLCRKGLEVNTVLIEGKSAALVWATWIPEENQE